MEKEKYSCTFASSVRAKTASYLVHDITFIIGQHKSFVRLDLWAKKGPQTKYYITLGPQYLTVCVVSETLIPTFHVRVLTCGDSVSVA